MDAPLYPAAVAFELPVRVPCGLSTKDTSVADLKAIPAAWAVILKELPRIEALFGNEMLKPHLGNFSFRSLLQFGVVQPEALDRIDKHLRVLGTAK